MPPRTRREPPRKALERNVVRLQLQLLPLPVLPALAPTSKHLRRRRRRSVGEVPGELVDEVHKDESRNQRCAHVCVRGAVAAAAAAPLAIATFLAAASFGMMVCRCCPGRRRRGS